MHVEDEREVDILFVVESSMEMGEVQVVLARDLHCLTQALDAPRAVANDAKQAALPPFNLGISIHRRLGHVARGDETFRVECQRMAEKK